MRYISFFLLFGMLMLSCGPGQESGRPDIILIMADDLGWGDPAFNGHPVMKTPNLDRMAGGGLVFERFYSAAPVCSPTRGSVMTGRHPFRYGVFGANRGHMPEGEITMAEFLKDAGYRTGHFGKWHLGTLTREVVESNRGGRPENLEHYAPPWEHGFDVCFSTEAKVPTWDPMVTPSREAAGVTARQVPGEHYGTYYWTGEETRATTNLEGDNSRVIMDRAIPFIRESLDKRQPYLAVIWFHTPHSPVVAGRDYRNQYASFDENHQHYYGCITAMDDQIGRLLDELEAAGSLSSTMIWFNSDNGPAAYGGGPGQTKGGRQQGETGGFRERKGSLYEGGVRVPGILHWPGQVEGGRSTGFPAVTTDFLPTILDYLAIPVPRDRTLDGISLRDAIQSDTMKVRPRPIGFRHRRSPEATWNDNRYKLVYLEHTDVFELYDLYEDPYETTDIAEEEPDIVSDMKQALKEWTDEVDADLNSLRQ